MRKRAAKPKDKPAPATPSPPSEPAASFANKDEHGNIVIRSGRAKPSQDAELLGSDRDTCAYEPVKLLAAIEYQWEEWQDGDRRFPPMFRVQHNDSVVPVSRAVFARLFPEVMYGG